VWHCQKLKITINIHCLEAGDSPFLEADGDGVGCLKLLQGAVAVWFVAVLVESGSIKEEVIS